MKTKVFVFSVKLDQKACVLHSFFDQISQDKNSKDHGRISTARFACESDSDLQIMKAMI